MSVTVMTQQASRTKARRGPHGPKRQAPHAARRTAISCADVVADRPAAGWLRRVKTGVVAALMLLGGATAAAEFASWAEPNPELEYVAGHPAWAHVTQP